MSHTSKEAHVRRINARFRAATPRRYRHRWRPSIPAVLIGVMVVGAVGAVLMAPQTHLADPGMRNMSMKDKARHLLASPNCSAARLVGVAPPIEESRATGPPMTPTKTAWPVSRSRSD